MDSPFLLMAEQAILMRGCQFSIAEKVRQALADQPAEEPMVLWMRINGASYQEIADVLDCNKGTAWKFVNRRLRDHVYSVFVVATDLL